MKKQKRQAGKLNYRGREGTPGTKERPPGGSVGSSSPSAMEPTYVAKSASMLCIERERDQSSCESGVGDNRGIRRERANEIDLDPADIRRKGYQPVGVARQQPAS